MSTADLLKFPGGTQDKGLNNFEPAIDAEISWTEDTQNVTGGITRGVGPRYGIAPLAGHSNTESPPNFGANGIQRSESVTLSDGDTGLIFRKTIYGIVPITMAPYNAAYPVANQQFYIYLVGLDDSSNISIDACIGAIVIPGTIAINEQSSTLVAGLAQSSYRQESPLVRLHKTELINLPLDSTPTATNMKTILRQTASRYWMPYAHISVSGKRVPYQWMLTSRVGADPDATTAPSLNVWDKLLTVGTSPTIWGGSPSEIITREFTDNNQRQLTVYCLDTSGYPIDLTYTKNITQANTTGVTAYNDTTANYSGLTSATKTGASTAYSSVVAALINDPGSYTNTRHDAVLVAAETPFAIVYQDWLEATKGMMPRWVDLTNPACIPRNGLNLYPTYGNQGSGFPHMTNDGLQAGGAGTGILLDKTSYDFGFSYYNKLLDFETNVVFGASKLIDGADGVSMFMDYFSTSTFNVWENYQTSTIHIMPWEYSDTAAKSGSEVGRGMHINDYEIRFYYRETGTGEWLPAGNYDAAQYWYYGKWAINGATYGPQICTGPSAGLPGGQPNGFVDYSPLPNQKYICSAVFQQRAFWFSEKTMQFSYQNNIYAYPTRNIVACPTGKWRGGIVHILLNLAQQSSRIVVFGDNAFSGRFSGSKTLQNVRVSSTTVGQFEVDGSDFVMDYLCDATAFSYRSAVVAEGVLYWWGPQGVYRDDAVSKPVKISQDLEPNIFSYIDTSRDQEIHCVYLKRTGEITWFYPPKNGDDTYPTYGLVYNIKNGNFYPQRFKSQVDASQNIKIENDQTPPGVAGERILLHCRPANNSTAQRTFYYDDIVMAGDQGPSKELTIVLMSSPTTDTRQLTYALGSVGVTSGNIQVGDYLSLQNVMGYAPSIRVANDMIAKITAVSDGARRITIQLPPGANIDATATLNSQTSFPVYQMKPNAPGLHGINYKFQTQYWLPSGMSESYQWQYLYFLFKYRGIPTPLDPFTLKSAVTNLTLAYQTLVCRGPVSDVLTLVDNSSNHCQIHHPLRNEGRSANGQALAYSVSGIYIGDPWTLEYLEAHCLKEKGFTLKEFEG